MKYKESKYNIRLKEAGYLDGMDVSEDLVYNTMSGQLGVFPRTVNLINPPTKAIKNHFVIPENVDETDNYINFSHNFINDNNPQSVILTVATTFRCNYHCSYCFEQCDRTIDLSESTLTDYIHYIKKEIDENPNLKYFRIIWFGGEPLLRFDVIERISDFVIPYCDEKGIKYSAGVISNGYLLTKEVSAKLNNLRIKSIQITFDGFEETYNKYRKPPRNAYETVLNNIKNSVIPVIIRLHVLRDNRDEIEELAKFFDKMASSSNVIKEIWIHQVWDYTDKQDYILSKVEWIEYRNRVSMISDRIRKNLLSNDIYKPTYRSCRYVSKRNVILAPDGYLYKCDNNMGLQHTAVGTIKDGIWADCNNYTNYVSLSIDDECRNCILLPVCNGGSCRYETILYMEKNCDHMKNRFKQNIQFLVKDYIEQNQRPKHSLLPLRGENGSH